MIALMAHHLELRHVPVVLAIMAAGFWIGLEIAAKISGRKRP
jgi:hypothetical protein